MKFLFEQSNINYLKKMYIFFFVETNVYTEFSTRANRESSRSLLNPSRKKILAAPNVFSSKRLFPMKSPRFLHRASFIYHTKASSSLISPYFLFLHSVEYLPPFVVARARFHLPAPLLFFFCFFYRRDINRFDFTIGTHKNVYEDVYFARLRRFAHACQAVVR